MKTFTFTLKRWHLAAVFGLLFLVAIPLMADSCGGSGSNNQSSQQQQNEAANSRLHKAVPYPNLVNSQELNNQATWYKRLDDPNKVAYLYLVTNTGIVFAEYQIIAKCSSTNSMFSSPASVVDGSSVLGYGSTTPLVIPAPQPDGSYGQNENAVFCFLDDANKTMIEFSEQWNYVWSEQPLNLVTQPTIVVVPNGK